MPSNWLLFLMFGASILSIKALSLHSRQKVLYIGIISLSQRAKVQKAIPKNAFDTYANTKQKKLFSNLISRITWLYKLSPETVNLERNNSKEIQIFQIDMMINEDPKVLLDIIDKSIPYSIIFIVEFDGKFFLSTSAKH